MDTLFQTIDAVFKAAFNCGYYVHADYTQVLKSFMMLEGAAAEVLESGRFQVAQYLALPFAKAWQALLTT